MSGTCIGCHLNGLLPPSIADDPEQAAFELVRAVMIRSTYIPGVRHRLGWCGIHESVTPDTRPGSITAKVNDRSGVFALHPMDTGPGHVSRFGLSYFPAPDEPVVEQFSIEAGIQALAPDFTGKIRQFGRDPELTGLFHLGHIECLKADHGIFVAFQARQRLAWTSAEGIVIQTPDGPVQAVAPGEMDQDIDAFHIGLSFFRPLAASFTYTLGACPSVFYTQQCRAAHRAPQLADTLEQRWTLGYFSNGQRAGAPDLKAPPGMTDAPCKVLWAPAMPIPPSHVHEPWWDKDLAGAGNSLDKKAVGITDKPRFILLTGFLGAGKTSFLDHFIQAQTAANNFVAVVQNEIGERGLDAVLLDQTYAVTQMDEGCVCCSLAGSLRAALTDILDRFQPDFIVLETTGLANPANILAEIDDLDDLFEFGSITTVMDSCQGGRALERFEVARDQVRLADVVLLNKCDLLESDPGRPGLDTLKAKIHRLNPTVEIHQTCHGDIHPGVLYGVNFRNPMRRPLFSALGARATHHDDRIETRLVDLDGPVCRTGLEAAIRAGKDRILRVKGIAEFQDQSGPMVFQYAPGTCRISKFQGQDTGDRFLVVIGQDLKDNFDDRRLLKWA